MLLHITYIVLHLVMLFFLWVAGCRIARLRRVTWQNLYDASWPGIVAFTLNEGLRFGRGLDYNLYAEGYLSPSQLDYDALFYLLVNMFKGVGLPWQALVFFMSFVLIMAAVALMRHFPKAAPLALPAFYFFAAFSAENLMRWYFGLSPIMVGLSFYLDNFTEGVSDKRKLRNLLIFAGCSITGFFIHFGIILVPMGYYLLSLLKKPMMHPLVAIALFIGIGVSFQTSFMLEFTQYVNLFSMLGSPKVESYLAESDVWLTGGSDVLADSLRAFPSIGLSIFYCVGLWASYFVVRRMDYRPLTIVYNIFIIGFILLPVANQIEIFSRYDQTFFMFQFLLWPYVLKFVAAKASVFRRPLARMLVYAVVCFFCFSTLRAWITSPDYKVLYVWDANGRYNLDLDSTYYYDMKYAN